MNGELDYDDILHFPKEIVVEKINNFYLVIAVQTANWIVLYNSKQIDFLDMLRAGKCIGDVIETVESTDFIQRKWRRICNFLWWRTSYV